MRELAGHLNTPVFVIDLDGALLYYNESAEPILGLRFDETGPMPLAEWSTVFQPSDENGLPLDPSQLPLVIALREQRAAHGRLCIRALDGTLRTLEVTAIPLVGLASDQLGAAAFFWEVAP
jgi:PAS domain-containing protein